MAWSPRIRPAHEPELDLSILPPPRQDLFPDQLASSAGDFRACCCPAAPHVQILMPDHGPRSAPLLLCMHHWRQHRERLTMLGAAAYGMTGQRVEAGSPAGAGSRQL